MPAAIAWFGFVSGWLLFAGPIFQAAYELAESEVDREGFRMLADEVPRPDPVSPWWWLLPPIAYIKSRQRSHGHREAWIKAMSREQRHQAVVFQQVAHGWLIVATGAYFFAIKETWELGHHHHWKGWVIVAAVVGMTILSLTHTSGRMARAAKLQRLAQEAP